MAGVRLGKGPQHAGATITCHKRLHSTNTLSWPEHWLSQDCKPLEAVCDGSELCVGSSKGGSISTEDLVTVRECGSSMLERFRQEALKVSLSSNGLVALEHQQVRLCKADTLICRIDMSHHDWGALSDFKYGVTVFMP